MIIYVYRKCSTCKDALCFLKAHQLVFEVKEIQLEPPTIKELKQMLDYKEGKLKKLFNTSGLLYKEMNLAERFDNLQPIQALELLSKHGMLVKRPFVLGKNFGLLGFKEGEWKEILHIKS